MATRGNSKENVVRLPQSGEDFFTQLKAGGCSSKFAAGTMGKKSSLPVELQQMIHYSYPALINGRPLNKVMIVLVGQTGAGKSTTINVLFNDSICKTSATSSETRTVTEYGKELCVTDPGSPSVKGTLSFVDPPGALDVDKTKEATNLAVITKFRDENPDLRPRKGVLKASSRIREHVYPNLVLMVVHAADNRMEGPNSNLRKCLKALEKYRLVDRLYLNLMVVVTHAMSLSPKTYKQDTIRMTHIIQEAILNVLRLRKVQVVFVENMPEDYDIVKPEGCDFYELPDGQLSHYNLIRAMEKQFDQTGDVLGKLLCGWYFSDDCPEKEDKVTVLNSVQPTKLSSEDTKEALQMLASIDIYVGEKDDIVPPQFNFQFLGHGYCPKTEMPKDVTVYQETDVGKATLLNTLYTVPKCFQLNDVGEDHFLPVSFETKSSYENRRVAGYGLENNIKLVVSVESNGRWVKDNSKNKEALMRTVYEKQLLHATIIDPEDNIKKELMKAFDRIPEVYNRQTADQFQDFFRTCGSHFVHEATIGGYVTIDSQVKAASYTDKQGLEMFHKARAAFKSIIIPERGEAEYGNDPEGCDDKDVKKCTVAIEGGDPPQVTMLSELTAVRFTDWVETLKLYPVELQYSLKLTPYYILIKNAKRKSALTQATLQYLEGTMPQYVPIVTPTKKYDKLMAEVGPNPRSIVEELRRYQTGEGIKPSRIKRNDVGCQIVESAQAEAKKQDSKCVIL